MMGENGVSHYVVNDDLEGVKVVLRWLSYCPPQLGAEPPLLPTSDPVDRPVAYEAGEHEKLDPRAAISGAWAAWVDPGREAGTSAPLHDECHAAAGTQAQFVAPSMLGDVECLSRKWAVVLQAGPLLWADPVCDFFCCPCRP